MNRKQANTRSKALGEFKNLKNIVADLEQAFTNLNDVLKKDQQNGTIARLSAVQDNFAKLKQIVSTEQSLSKYHQNLVVMYHVLSEYQRELGIERKTLGEKRTDLEKVGRDLGDNLLEVKDLKDGLGNEKSALQDCVKELQQTNEKLSGKVQDLEQERQAYETKHSGELQKVRDEVKTQMGVLSKAIEDAKEIEKDFGKREQALHTQIGSLKSDLQQKKEDFLVHKDLEKNLKDAQENLAVHLQFLNLPDAWHITRQFFLTMQPLFKDVRFGLAWGSYASLRAEHDKLSALFKALSPKLGLEIGTPTTENLRTLMEILRERENHKKDFIESFIIPMATPFCRAYQLVNHIPQSDPELIKKEIGQNYRRFRAIASVMGIHLHEIELFETGPNGNLHELRGFGCQTEVLQDVFENLRQKNLLPSPCITDLWENGLGFKSDVDGIETKKSIVRTFKR